MKSIVLMLVLLAQKGPPGREFPADIDAAKEAKQNEKQIFANDILRVFHVSVPSGMKELHFAPDKTGFFVVGGKQVIWHDRPVIVRGEAVHVEFVKYYAVSGAAAKDGALFENSLVRVQIAPVEIASVGKKIVPVVEWPKRQKAFTIRGLGRDGSAGVTVTLKCCL